jgi:RNA polymerase sigma-70 factor (ECF subfamily)
VNFDEVYGYRSKLMAYAMRLTMNRADAADLVQSTLERAWIYRDSYIEDRLFGWLRQIMRNLYFDSRVRGRSVKALNVYVESDEVLHPEYPCAGEISCELDEVLDQIGSMNGRGQALLLTRLGYSYADVAKLQGVEVGTIKSRVNRAEQELLEAIA